MIGPGRGQGHGQPLPAPPVTAFYGRVIRSASSMAYAAISLQVTSLMSVRWSVALSSAVQTVRRHRHRRRRRRFNFCSLVSSGTHVIRSLRNECVDSNLCDCSVKIAISTHVSAVCLFVRVCLSVSLSRCY